MWRCDDNVEVTRIFRGSPPHKLTAGVIVSVVVGFSFRLRLDVCFARKIEIAEILH
jgi:hypothetical protein